MKTIIRTFVIALTITGAVASVNTSRVMTSAQPKLSAFPIPVCPPNDPNACGIVSTK